MTIDLGFAWTDAALRAPTVAFVDVPGHERFVTTMLAGVGPVPAVLLVVAADEGWMPQSAEHVDALRRARRAPRPARGHPQRPAGPRAGPRRGPRRTWPAPRSPSCPRSCVSADHRRRAWTSCAPRSTSSSPRLPVARPGADVRLWVDRAFTIRGAGTVVTGTLRRGPAPVDDELELRRDRRRPAGDGARAAEPRRAGAERSRGVARVAVNLRGCPAGGGRPRATSLLTPGAWLATDGARRPAARRARRRRRTRPTLPEQLTLHVGSAAVAGPGAAARRRHRPAAAAAQPLPLRIGDRAVLRDPGRRRGRRRPDRARRRAAAAAPARCRGPPRRRAGRRGRTRTPPASWRRRGVARRADLVAMGVPAPDVDALAARARRRRLAASTPSRRLRSARRLAAAVAAHDAADPLDPGLPVEAARRAARAARRRGWSRRCCGTPAPGAEPGLALRDGRVARAAGGGLPAAVRAALDALRADLQRDPFARPGRRPARRARPGPAPAGLAGRRRRAAARRRRRGAAARRRRPGASTVLAGLGPEFTLSAARQALGTSRRVAVPLLELLARTGRTARTAGRRPPARRDPRRRSATGARSGSASAGGPTVSRRCPRPARTRRPTRRRRRRGGEADDQITLSTRTGRRPARS